MLVCHCNIISERDIEEAIRGLLGADPWQLIVPAKVYHALGKRGRCCCCFPNVVDIIIRETERHHARTATDPVRLVDVRRHLETLRTRHGRPGHEGRTPDHRAA